MNLIEKIKAIFGLDDIAPDVIHSYFGSMTSEINGQPDDLWQTEMLFEPLNRKIVVDIYAGAEGPDSRHIEFYEHFTANYVALIQRVSAHVLKELQSRHGVKSGSSFETAFELFGVLIPREGDINNLWSLCFTCLADAEGYDYVVELEQNIVSGVIVFERDA